MMMRMCMTIAPKKKLKMALALCCPRCGMHRNASESGIATTETINDADLAARRNPTLDDCDRARVVRCPRCHQFVSPDRLARGRCYIKCCGKTQRAHQYPRGSGDFRIVCKECGVETWEQRNRSLTTRQQADKTLGDLAFGAEYR